MLSDEDTVYKIRSFVEKKVKELVKTIVPGDPNDVVRVVNDKWNKDFANMNQVRHGIRSECFG
jgi:hypothetical protein